MKLMKIAIEIRAGTGGLEASFIIGDLFRCMRKYVIKKWSLELISISKEVSLKEVIASIRVIFTQP